MTGPSTITQDTEDEIVEMAEKAYEEYLSIIHRLSDERREAFHKQLKETEDAQISKIRSQLQQG